MNGNLKYVIFSITTIVIAGLVASVVIFIDAGGSDANQERQTAILIGSILGFLAPTVAALLAVLKTAENSERIDDVHRKVDSGQPTPTTRKATGAVHTAISGTEQGRRV